MFGSELLEGYYDGVVHAERAPSDGSPLFARDVLMRLSSKWSMCVLHVLDEQGEAVRYSTLMKEIPGITQKVLTDALRNLERDGFIERKIYRQVPPRVEYRLSALGCDLLKLVNPVIWWTRRNADRIATAQHRFDLRSEED
jgi:DNA-binding HxlR family transcriptional regulator